MKILSGIGWVLVWVARLLWRTFFRGILGVLTSMYGLIAGVLHVVLAFLALAGAVFLVPEATLTCYQWILHVCNMIPGFADLTGGFTRHAETWIQAPASFLHLDAAVVARSKLLVLIPWTPPGWLIFFFLWKLTGVVVDLPHTIKQQIEEDRQAKMRRDLEALQARVKKMEPREGEILSPEKPPVAELPAARRLLSRQK
ncbi:hypothetical protein HYT05_01905 [Candidatus Kaiserbacteria bacterium]|nr:hypothetical protein [Candidatus Kaiserbacteria bacterium]